MGGATVEIEMGSLRVALEQQIPEADWAQARFDQLNLLDERRLRAADHVRAYQRKMARAFKKRFRPNWSGPYFIRELTPEGASCRSPPFFTYSLFHCRFLSLFMIHLILFTSYFLLTTTHLGFDASSVHGSWGSLYMLHFIYEGMSFEHWVFEPSFLSFISPCHLGLTFVRVLRPPRGHGIDVVLASTWTVIEIWLIFRYFCTIIITYWMLSETWTWSLPYRAPEIHPASSALLDAWMPSCLSIWEMTSCHVVLRACRAPDAILGHIFHDFMSPDFRPVVHPMPYWGIFPFWVRFTDLRGGHVLDDR
ncbi:hypothetical protein AAG906_027924 [Vitis piasezkii]